MATTLNKQRANINSYGHTKESNPRALAPQSDAFPLPHSRSPEQLNVSIEVKLFTVIYRNVVISTLPVS